MGVEPVILIGTWLADYIRASGHGTAQIGRVIQEAYVHGISTRSVDDLVKAMGMTGISKSQVSRLCEEIDGRVKEFLNRPIEGSWPYVWIDATYVKTREGGRIVSIATIVAVGVNTDGRREVLGKALGPSEAEPFWTQFLRSLTARGLRGVKLVISDAHEGIKAAVKKVFHASWQRCRVHFMRNAMAHAGVKQRAWSKHDLHPTASRTPDPSCNAGVVQTCLAGADVGQLTAADASLFGWANPGEKSRAYCPEEKSDKFLTDPIGILSVFRLTVAWEIQRFLLFWVMVVATCRAYFGGTADRPGALEQLAITRQVLGVGTHRVTSTLPIAYSSLAIALLLTGHCITCLWLSQPAEGLLPSVPLHFQPNGQPDCRYRVRLCCSVAFKWFAMGSTNSIERECLTSRRM